MADRSLITLEKVLSYPVCILVWPDFASAPPEYRALSRFGGDEEGIVLVPIGLHVPSWLGRVWDHEGEQVVELPEGKLIIWAHS